MNVCKLIEKCAILSCAFLVIGLPTVSYAQSDFDEIFIFGDSLSDAGNIYQLTGETSKAPYAVVPSRPYAIGGHHFSNGKTWAERLAQELRDNNGGKASLQNPGKNGNYAFGGASDMARRAYDTVYQSTEAGFAAARPGATPAP